MRGPEWFRSVKVGESNARCQDLTIDAHRDRGAWGAGAGKDFLHRGVNDWFQMVAEGHAVSGCDDRDRGRNGLTTSNVIGSHKNDQVFPV